MIKMLLLSIFIYEGNFRFGSIKIIIIYIFYFFIYNNCNLKGMVFCWEKNVFYFEFLSGIKKYKLYV